MTASELSSKVRRAFSSNEPLRDKPLVSGLGSPDDQEIAAYFQWRDWRTFTDVAGLRRHSAALSHFTADAYLYYLPAFLLADLTDPEEADVISGSLFFDFSRCDGPRMREVSERLTELQKKTLLEYFRFASARDGFREVELGKVTEHLTRLG